MKNLNKLQATTVLAAAMTVGVSAVYANPTGGSVAQGSAAIVEGGSTMNINQSSDRAVINWNTFNIANGETVNFNQPSANAATLNRIGDANPSQIQGSLNANGKVMLVNPNGVFFSNTSSVNVGSLVATTADAKDSDFMAGTEKFNKAGNANASITNNGTITVASGGMAVLVAPTVTNNGVINANGAKVALAGSDVFTIDPFGDKLVNFAVGTRTGDKANAATVNQNGNIFADAGQVQLTAKSVKSTVDAVVNTSGITQARSASSADGKIVLEGDRINMDGSFDASGNADGSNGGSVKATGRKSLAFGGDIDASGNGNGTAGGSIELKGASLALGGTANVAGGTGGTKGTASYLATGGTFHLDSAAANTIADTMGNGADVTIGAAKNVLVEADLDTTGQANDSTLDIVDTDSNGYLNANVHNKLMLGTGQSLSGEATKVTIHEDASIQNGVDMAAEGAAIKVYIGEYNENVDIRKNGLTITGANAGIAGNGTRGNESAINGYVNIQEANGVTFDGFEVNGGDFNGTFTGIRVKASDNATVANNDVYSDGVGIDVRNSYLTTVTGNSVDGGKVIADGDTGINLLDAQHAFVNNNDITNYETGIKTVNSDYANIRDNDIAGVVDGITLKGSYRGFIKNNDITGDGTGVGISVANSDKARVFTNKVDNVNDGLMVSHSSEANLDRNVVTNSVNGVNANFADSMVATQNKLTGLDSGFGFWIRNSNNVGFQTTGNVLNGYVHDQQLVNTTVSF